MKYHIVAFSLGVILDWLIGDPYWMPHPVRLMGRVIGWLDHRFMDRAVASNKRDKNTERLKGCLTFLIVIFLTVILTALVTFFSYWINTYLGIAIEAILTCYVLAARSLNVESMKVYKALTSEGIEKARYSVSMIVGRDTDELDEEGVIKACVETVAENTSDGIIAPLLYAFLGGAVLSMVYKAINTMDSMIGYHNDRFENFGFVAAKADDIANFIPSRISALAMVLASCILRGFNGKEAWRILRRDRFNHKSPNSAQTESVCAGALGVRLAGDAKYFGKIVHKPYIGDATRTIEKEDIKRSIKLMYGTELLVFVSCIFVLMGIMYLVNC